MSGGVPTRVAVFIDYQNTYMGVRAAMGWRHHHYVVGQVYPRRLGILLCDKGRQIDPDRRLEYVRVYRGEPSPDHSPKGQSACQRQVRFWDAQNAVTAITRPLKYYPEESDSAGNVTKWEPREKGIDVLIAIEMVMGAMNDKFDVAVLMSADSDLGPAVEAVRKLGKVCEVGAWDGPHKRSRLALTGQRVWCHWLKERDYGLVEDPTDYTVPQPGPPPATP